MSNAVIYSKPSCPYCVRAKSVLTSKGIAYTEVVYDGKTVTKEMLSTIIGVSPDKSETITFPQIFINDEYVGGFTDLCDKYGIRSKR